MRWVQVVSGSRFQGNEGAYTTAKSKWFQQVAGGDADQTPHAQHVIHTVILAPMKEVWIIALKQSFRYCEHA